MNNEEILKALRCCVYTECTKCPLNNGDPMDIECVSEMVRTAADLIEKMTDRCARYAEEIAVWQERQKWVPVTERLPESAGDYLCLVRYCNLVTGEMEKMQRTGYFTPLGRGAWGGDAIRGARAMVLAWMPLPDGPEVE